MPQRSKIITLPEEVKSELDKKLLTGKFCDYSAMAEWLQDKGFDISRSAIHRYGQEFEERLAAITLATEQAKAVAEAARDDEGAMNEALIRLVQTKAFEVLATTDSDTNLSKIGVMIAKLSKASVDQKKWAEEARKKAIAEAADEAVKSVKSSGLSAEKAEEIRNKILGIV